MSGINVLYVDDEQQNLDSFKAAFRRNCNVFLAVNVSEALRILEKEEIHVLFSDQRMPGITGVEFFKQVKEPYPDIPRILLTGYTDIEVLVDAINQGDIYRYITKPWDELEVLNSILNAFDYYSSQKELQSKMEELQRINDGLNRFVYSLSHELRAPIASASGILDLVKLEGEYEKSGEYWGLMEACIRKMDYYVTQTVQFYKTTRFNVKSERIYFQQLLDSLIKIYSMSYGEQSIAFEMHVDENVPFYGDAFRVEIIIANLLSNAIKNQRKEEMNKQISVTIQTNTEDARIMVADNGTGIAQGDLVRIFDQFFKGANPEGLGLGLYILKESVNKLGGTIDVESELGKGAVFHLTLPNRHEKNES